LVPLIGITGAADAGAKVRLLWKRRMNVALMVGVIIVLFAPQMWVWHEATGRWLVNSYAGSGQRFYFGHPEILKTLFAVNPHGLFPWSPLLILSCLGFCFIWRSAREMTIALVVVVLLNFYIISSWKTWWYGDGFGLRAIVDSLPLMAFPLAALYSSARSVFTRAIVAAPAVLCSGLTTLMMLHYWQLRVPFSGATWNQYWHLLSGPI
jgi:hypothetical protein